MKQKICIITGSRAEYGLYKPLLKRLQKDKKTELQLLVTGTHLSPAFGNTFKEIISDGFKINSKVAIKIKGDTKAGVATSAGLALNGIAAALGKLQPDLVFLLGDRFEMLAAAMAAHIMRIPVAHIHGGEITEGSLDDAMRHAITKLSALHFTSTAAYRKRVIQMGEEPSRVFHVGSLGVENALHLPLLTQQQLEKKLGMVIQHPLAVVTMHPATNEKTDSERQIKSLLNALDSQKDLQLVITFPNADAEGKMIINYLKSFYAKNKKRVHLVPSLGVQNYLSLLKFADVVIGNSSSGIIEVPSFGIPSINIGDRQKSRLAAASVIHVKPTALEINKAITKAFSSQFKKKCSKAVNPYGDGNASDKIVTILHKYQNFRSIEKKFFDL